MQRMQVLCFAKLPYLCMLCMHPSDAKHAKQWVGCKGCKARKCYQIRTKLSFIYATIFRCKVTLLCNYHASFGSVLCKVTFGCKGCRLLVTLTFGSSVTLQLCFAKLPYLCMLCMHPSDAKHAKQWVGCKGYRFYENKVTFGRKATLPMLRNG